MSLKEKIGVAVNIKNGQPPNSRWCIVLMKSTQGKERVVPGFFEHGTFWNNSTEDSFSLSYRSSGESWSPEEWILADFDSERD